MANVKKKTKPAESKAPFVWNEIEMWHLPDIVETLQLIDDENEALSFYEAYIEVCDDEEHAMHSLGYMARLISETEGSDVGQSICDWFEIDYQLEPVQVFGKAVRRHGSD